MTMLPALDTLPTPDIVTVYGADWCGDCRRAKRFLDALAVPYRYVDLELDAVAQQLVDDAGYRAIPVIVTPAGHVLIEPSDEELAAALGIAA
jgi:mycoredoxin